MGQALALRALQAGHNVVGTVRNRSKSAEAVKSIEDAGGKIVEVDMTESQACISKKMRAAEAVYGRIDYLINSAGYSLFGPLELLT